MANYVTEVTPTTDRRYPFLLTVRDELGKLIGTFPVLSRADADAALAEVLAGLGNEVKNI